MVKLTHPDEGFSGTVNGVEFVDGVGHAERADLVFYFQRKGYRVEHAEPPVVAVPADEVPDPDRPAKNAKTEVWAAYAMEQGVPSFEAQNMTRAQLIERLGG